MCIKGSGPHSAAKQGRSFRVAALKVHGPCMPKAAEATFCSKTGPFFSCGCSKLGSES